MKRSISENDRIRGARRCFRLASLVVEAQARGMKWINLALILLLAGFVCVQRFDPSRNDNANKLAQQAALISTLERSILELEESGLSQDAEISEMNASAERFRESWVRRSAMDLETTKKVMRHDSWIKSRIESGKTDNEITGDILKLLKASDYDIAVLGKRVDAIVKVLTQ